MVPIVSSTEVPCTCIIMIKSPGARFPEKLLLRFELVTDIELLPAFASTVKDVYALTTSAADTVFAPSFPR